MKLEIFRVKLGLNSCYLIRGKDVVMVDGGMPKKLKVFKMIYPGHGKPFPIEVIKKSLD